MVTKEYIKMCEQAEEIQKAWKPEEGDYFYGYEWSDVGDNGEVSKYAEKRVHLAYFSGGYDSCFPIGEEAEWRRIKPDLSKCCWLPTLDQLFEMVGGYKKQTDKTFLSIILMKKRKFESIQELVLNAVMEVKYHKTWNGEKWVKKGGE